MLNGIIAAIYPLTWRSGASKFCTTILRSTGFSRSFFGQAWLNPSGDWKTTKAVLLV